MIRQFNHKDFLPLQQLLAAKKAAGTVSLVIPAVNEATTIGQIVTVTREALVHEIPLVDEIVVMGGRSADATAEVARKAGATVHMVDEVLADQAVPSGKGSALWKSLAVTRGDIVACIDADIVDFHPRFVYGIIAPLLLHRELSFVKAFYERPLEVNHVIVENYGGRVTELLVRPLLAAFYPELARLFQPLAGEYAFRRGLVEQIPFFSGYSVDIGLVLEVFKRHGLSCFAQVDMGTRRHRNRNVRDLGKMAFAILHAILHKLAEEKKISLRVPLGSVALIPCDTAFEESLLDEIELAPVCEFLKGKQ